MRHIVAAFCLVCLLSIAAIAQQRITLQYDQIPGSTAVTRILPNISAGADITAGTLQSCCCCCQSDYQSWYRYGTTQTTLAPMAGTPTTGTVVLGGAITLSDEYLRQRERDRFQFRMTRIDDLNYLIIYETNSFSLVTEPATWNAQPHYRANLRIFDSEGRLLSEQPGEWTPNGCFEDDPVRLVREALRAQDRPRRAH